MQSLHAIFACNLCMQSLHAIFACNLCMQSLCDALICLAMSWLHAETARLQHEVGRQEASVGEQQQDAVCHHGAAAGASRPQRAAPLAGPCALSMHSLVLSVVDHIWSDSLVLCLCMLRMLLRLLIDRQLACLVIQWVHVGAGRREARGGEQKEEEEAQEEGQAQGRPGRRRCCVRCCRRCCRWACCRRCCEGAGTGDGTERWRSRYLGGRCGRRPVGQADPKFCGR